MAPTGVEAEPGLVVAEDPGVALGAAEVPVVERGVVGEAEEEGVDPHGGLRSIVGSRGPRRRDGRVGYVPTGAWASRRRVRPALVAHREVVGRRAPGRWFSLRVRIAAGRRVAVVEELSRLFDLA